MFIRQILSFFGAHRKVLFFIGFIVGILILSGDSVFAVTDAGGAGGATGGTTGASVTGIDKKDLNKIVGILNAFITGISALMGMVTAFISMFLYPGWVNGSLFGLQEYLKVLWILISNIVYFIFAFILIAIAFMNIIGKGEGTWELKQAMPKFIVGVLIVPFSWFMVQFVLSISAILTVGVLTLPYDSFQGKELYQDAITALGDEKICKDIIITFSNTPGGDGGSTAITGSDGEALSENIRCKDGGEIEIQKIFTGEGDGAGLQNSIFGIISVYTYGILQIQEMDTITGTDLESIKTVADLVFKIVFDLLFIIVYLLLMVALMLALFVRGIRLWIFAMLSPVFGLLYFFGKSGDGGGKMEKFTPKEFIALALVPVYVSAALAFGMVFIMVASQGIKTNTDVMQGDTLNVGGFSLTIEGAHGNGESEKSVIGKLIVEIFGVVILWIAVMAALGASKTTEAIVKPIADFGDSVGKLAAAAPTYAPIIPTGTGKERMSVAGLGTFGGTLQQKISSGSKERGASFANEVFGGGNEVVQAIDKLGRDITQQNFQDMPSTRGKEAIEKLLEEMNGNWDNSITRKKAIEQLIEWMPERKEELERVTTFATAKSILPGVFEAESDIGVVASEWRKLMESGGTTPPAGTPPVSNVANKFNLTATIVDDAVDSTGNIDTSKIEAVKTAIQTVNITPANKNVLRTAIIEQMNSGTQIEKEARADKLLEALGLS